MYPIVLIDWADAHLSVSGWLTLDDYEDEGEQIVQSVGFLVPIGEAGSKKDHATLWQTLSDGDAIHAMHIPVAMIRKMKILVKAKE